MPNNWYLYKYGQTRGLPLSTVQRTVSIDDQKLGGTQELYSGNLVRDIIHSDKRKISIAWTWLPHMDTNVRDGGMGFYSLLDLYNYSVSGGLLVLEKPNGDGTVETAYVFLDKSACKVKLQRIDKSGTDSLFWDVSMSMEEQ